MSINKGKITFISGSVVHVVFTKTLPAVFNALSVQGLILEVQGYVDANTVRTLAMGSTQGLARGMEVQDLGHPIEVPVGQKVLGRMLDALGNPIDKKAAPKAPIRSIHAQPKPLADLDVSNQIFVTGLNAIVAPDSQVHVEVKERAKRPVCIDRDGQDRIADVRSAIVQQSTRKRMSLLKDRTVHR